MALKDRKVLFFIAGNAPTAQEQELIDRIVGNVKVRTLLTSSLYGSAIEPCDAVAAAPTSTIPAAYSGKDDITPAPGTTSVEVVNGDSLPVLTNDGDKSALTTGATTAGVTLTAVENGVDGDDISFEKITQVPTPSAPLAISVSAKKITARLGTSAGAKQKDTATVVGTVTATVRQVETATAAGTIVTATPQVETATAAGSVSGDGNAAVVVTGAGITGSPVTLAVAVLNGDTPTAWAAKVRTAINANAAIAALYTAGGTGTAITLTRNAAAANDGTLNISLATGTATGITTAASSANTTAGVAADGNGLGKVVVTAAGLAGSPLTVKFSVAAGDTAALWAAKARAALLRVAAITDFFDVSGSTTAIVLTRKGEGANDGTLNIALDNDTSTGITTAATSANTTAGVAGGAGNATVVITSAALTGSPLTVSVPVCAGDTASIVAGKIRDKLNTIEAIVGDGFNEASRIFTVGGSGATVSLERFIVAANDSSLNISVDNGTCTGLTTAASSANTTAGAIVAISTTAAQLATAINAHPEAAGLVSAVAVSGGASVVVAVAETHLAGGADPTVNAAAVAVVQSGIVGTLPS